MNLRQYIKKHDLTQEQCGRRLGVSQAMVSQWLKGDPITADRAVAIEKKTKGEILREDLRPDLFRRSEQRAA